MSDLLYAIVINTNSNVGEFVNELLPSIDLFPTSYFDSDDDIARLSLYFDSEDQAEKAKSTIIDAFQVWAEFSEVRLDAVEILSKAIKKEDWSEKWKEFFHVEKISDRIVIKPSWEEYEAKSDEVVIEIDPGMSFGTGNHGTTRGCLKLLDTLSNHLNGSFLDMGCGSGILSIAASKLGFDDIDAFDYDENSVKIARENISLTGCSNIDIEVDDLYIKSFSPKYSLVIANILAPVLIDNAEKIASTLNGDEGSRLILSGILHEQFPKVKETFESQGLKLLEQIKIDKWSTGLFRKTNS